MDLTASAELAHPVAAVYAEVRDLAGYPAWLRLVEGSVPAPDPEVAAWSVTLTARMGPVRRAKRVRMVRAVDQAPRMVRFERAECDGRRHAPWVLTAEVDPVDADPSRSVLTMDLHYGGRSWSALVEPLVRQEVLRAAPRLAAQLARRAGAPGSPEHDAAGPGRS